VVRNARWADYLQLAPLFDYGRAWNTRQAPKEPLSISSVGIGIRWALTIPSRVELRPQVEIYWGHPLREIKTSGGDPQDDGIHFQFVLGLF
jgi:hemolysin activation/secretion protein